jgi:hypothetical protein
MRYHPKQEPNLTRRSLTLPYKRCRIRKETESSDCSIAALCLTVLAAALSFSWRTSSFSLSSVVNISGQHFMSHCVLHLFCYVFSDAKMRKPSGILRFFKRNDGDGQHNKLKRFKCPAVNCFSRSRRCRLRLPDAQRLALGRTQTPRDLHSVKK